MVSRCLILDNCEDGKLDSTSTGTSMISLRTVVLLLTRSNDGGSQILHQRLITGLLFQGLRGPQDIFHYPAVEVPPAWLLW